MSNNYSSTSLISEVQDFLSQPSSTTPWSGEPDLVIWEDPTTHYLCCIKRHPHFHNLLGYVRVPESHPLYGADYEAPDVDVHGGLSFAGALSVKDEHSGGSAIPEGFWFGFDCGHAGDLIPYMDFPSFPGDQYRTVDYVRAECTNLAQQLAALAQGTTSE